MKYPTCLVFISIHFNRHFNRNLGKLGPFPENYTEDHASATGVPFFTLKIMTAIICFGGKKIVKKQL